MKGGIRRYLKTDYQTAFNRFQKKFPNTSQYYFFAQFNSVVIGESSEYLFLHTSEDKFDASSYPGQHLASDYGRLADKDAKYILESVWSEDDPLNPNEKIRVRRKKNRKPALTATIETNLIPHRFA